MDVQRKHLLAFNAAVLEMRGYCRNEAPSRRPPFEDIAGNSPQASGGPSLLAARPAASPGLLPRQACCPACRQPPGPKGPLKQTGLAEPRRPAACQTPMGVSDPDVAC